MEAFLSHKPVICCVDSGGTDELVFDGRNGLVVEPTPEAIADAMDRLYADKTAARRLGAEGRKTLAEKNINWDYIIDRIAA
jgi:glycosyltransferase involved in cell wall biosynthesis